MKAGGGVAGHNGLRSVGAEIGDAFRRLRIGVGHPGVKDAVAGYVLHDLSKADMKWLEPLLDAVAAEAPLLAEGKDQTFANRLHAALNPEAEVKAGKQEPTASGGKPAQVPGAADAVPEPAKSNGPFAGLKKLFGK
jgi:PTH1 family peptidyl-tRNA hydrolase